jgi:hypothetical protein
MCQFTGSALSAAIRDICGSPPSSAQRGMTIDCVRRRSSSVEHLAAAIGGGYDRNDWLRPFFPAHKTMNHHVSPRQASIRRIAGGIVVLLMLAAAAVLALRRADDRRESGPVDADGGSSTRPASVEDFRPQVAAFCGDCHGMPSPAGFPQVAWYDEVQMGYDFYFKSGRNDLPLPGFDQVVDWFRAQAPPKIVIPRHEEAAGPAKLSFRTSDVTAAAEGLDRQPAVSFIRFGALAPGDASVLLWCNMLNGELRSAEPGRPQSPSKLLGTLANPAHVEPCDLDGDGRVDLVVADLGSFQPADHSDGKVVWLRRTAEGDWQPSVLQAGLGRVADVQPGDFDGDGDLDLVIAEFGWRKTGRILLLENRLNTGTAPDFRLQVVDSRHGTIHVPPIDLDGDGRLDFVALISQEHETVVAFLNDGAGGFRRETIFSANEPAFGSTGIQLVDLDGDGDLDVLYTNGDAFDSFYLRPFHSIRWLENRGVFPFEDHRLAVVPGVHRALACDLDGDGDLDIAAASLLPDRMQDQEARSEFDSLLWLENVGGKAFVRHSLERGQCEHAALEVGDFDGDGDFDLAVGTFGYSAQRRYPSLTVWWNLRNDGGDADQR